MCTVWKNSEPWTRKVKPLKFFRLQDEIPEGRWNNKSFFLTVFLLIFVFCFFFRFKIVRSWIRSWPCENGAFLFVQAQDYPGLSWLVLIGRCWFFLLVCFVCVRRAHISFHLEGFHSFATIITLARAPALITTVKYSKFVMPRNRLRTAAPLLIRKTATKRFF